MVWAMKITIFPYAVYDGEQSHAINHSGFEPVYVSILNQHDEPASFLLLERRFLVKKSDRPDQYWKITCLHGQGVDYNNVLTFDYPVNVASIRVGSAASELFHLNLKILNYALREDPATEAQEVMWLRTIGRALRDVVKELLVWPSPLVSVTPHHIFGSMKLLEEHYVALKRLKNRWHGEHYGGLTGEEDQHLCEDLQRFLEYLDEAEASW